GRAEECRRDRKHVHGPMLALNGISRKFHKCAAARARTYECPAARRVRRASVLLGGSYFSLSSVSLASFSDSAWLPAPCSLVASPAATFAFAAVGSYR